MTAQRASNAAPSTIIDLNDVTLTLDSRAGPVEILKGVSLRLEAGRSYAIVGPSGSGKTSLMMVMAGLERATTGQVIVAGHDLGTLGEDQLAQVRGRDIGIVFQSFHLIPTMTALENVALPLELTDRTDVIATAQTRLKDVGLGHRLDHYPSQLSGGEQQRVALARAMAPMPRLLLADEPTGNLDKATGEQIIKLLFELQATSGATLVLVTHDPALAARCDTQIAMADGLLSSLPTQDAHVGRDAAAATGKSDDGEVGAAA